MYIPDYRVSSCEFSSDRCKKEGRKKTNITKNVYWLSDHSNYQENMNDSAVSFFL